MMVYDRETIEKILNQLETLDYPFSFYKVNREQGNPKLIGKGGFSFVYEMIDKNNHDNKYAMKIMGFSKHLTNSEDFWNTCRIQYILHDDSKFIQRIISAKELLIQIDDNCNIVSVQDIKEDDDVETGEGILLQFILMDKLEDIISSDKFNNVSLLRDELTDEKNVIKFALQIGQAIQITHENNVFHRDIKLENIFWNPIDKCYVLGDFGIAKTVEDGKADTVVFTKGYGAPEIERRLAGDYNVTADIYSFGVTIYLLLNNLRFPASSKYVVSDAQYEMDFIFPAPFNGSVEMVRLIQKMCSFNPKNRFQSMYDVLVELENILNERDDTEDIDVKLPDFSTVTFYENVDNEDNSMDKYYEENYQRIRKKQELKEAQKTYNKDKVRTFLAITTIIGLLLRGLRPDATFAMDWRLFIFIGAVASQAFFLKKHVLYKSFGLIAFGIGVFSANSMGFSVVHLILFITLILSLPAITAAGVAGTFLWMFLSFNKNFSWIKILDIINLNWILIIFLVICILRHVYIFLDTVDDEEVYE